MLVLAFFHRRAEVFECQLPRGGHVVDAHGILRVECRCSILSGIPAGVVPVVKPACLHFLPAKIEHVLPGVTYNWPKSARSGSSSSPDSGHRNGCYSPTRSTGHFSPAKEQVINN